MATISQVAKHAGVSTKTVSRVMSNYPHISPKTRLKVEEAIQDLTFTPISIARNNRMTESLSIGMLYGDPSSGYQARLNHAVLKACSDARRYLAVELFDEAGVDWVLQVEAFLNRTNVRSMILVPPLCDAIGVHQLLEERGVRYVLVSPSRPVSGSVAVIMDDRLASKEITEHLLELGHTRIGHICGHPDHVVTLLRQQGFEEAMVRAGLADSDHMTTASGKFRFRDSLEVAEKMLAAPNRPTAIFAANDEMASAVVMAAHRQRLQVPDDLSVAGFDDAPIASSMWPDLTTISQPFEAIGRSAIAALAETTAGPEGRSQTIILPHKLIKRASTASLSD